MYRTDCCHIVQPNSVLALKKKNMKKISIPFDGSHFSEGAFRFANNLNHSEPVLLAGLFLPEISYPGMYGFTGWGVLEIPALVSLLETDSDETIEANIGRFKELCLKHSIEHRIHKGTEDFGLAQLQKESRYSDLLIIGSQLFYNNNADKTEPYLTKLLHHSECPVLIVPENYEFPENIILAYDGTSSSVYAIKQFAYLFPALCKKSALLVYAGSEENKKIPDLQYIEELAARHFSDLTISALETEPSKYFDTWVGEGKAPLLVTGAYDRSALSQFFKESFAEKFISDYKMPLFVAHR
jgi:nucleotide-binding universal stress UspA family protein